MALSLSEEEARRQQQPSNNYSRGATVMTPSAPMYESPIHSETASVVEDPMAAYLAQHKLRMSQKQPIQQPLPDPQASRNNSAPPPVNYGGSALQQVAPSGNTMYFV